MSQKSLFKEPVPVVEAYCSGSFFRARVTMPGEEPRDIPYLHANTRAGAVREACRQLRQAGHRKYEVAKAT